MAPRHHLVDRVGLAFEDRLNAAVAPVADEARHAPCPSLAGTAVPEEHALYLPLDLHPAANRHRAPTLP